MSESSLQIKQQCVNVIFIVNNLLLVNFIVLAFTTFYSVIYRIQVFNLCQNQHKHHTTTLPTPMIEIPVVFSVSLRAVLVAAATYGVLATNL